MFNRKPRLQPEPEYCLLTIQNCRFCQELCEAILPCAKEKAWANTKKH